jgi:hypothetical protein
VSDAFTPRQRELARHALGLTDGNRRSYRNRFYAPPKSENWWEWSALVDRGLAVFDPGDRMDLFTLTRTAAETVLERGESLDLEDFPHD